MLCNRCEEAEATVHQITMDNSQVTHLQLCEACAKEVQTGAPASGDSVSQIASSLFQQTTDETTCSRCGTSFADFRQTGRLGCSGCYQAFEDRMKSLIHRIHGSEQHVGRSTSGGGLSTISPERKVQILEKRLERAVQEEDYETAAELRDQIEDLSEDLDRDVTP